MGIGKFSEVDEIGTSVFLEENKEQ